jgi:hypothetical protein
MPDSSMPCRRANPDTASWPFLGWPTRRVGGLRPSSSLLDTPRRKPMLPVCVLLGSGGAGGGADDVTLALCDVMDDVTLAPRGVVPWGGGGAGAGGMTVAVGPPGRRMGRWLEPRP